MQLVGHFDPLLHALLQIPLQYVECLVDERLLHLHDVRDELLAYFYHFGGVLIGDDHNVEQLKHLHFGSALVFNRGLEVVDDVRGYQRA